MSSPPPDVSTDAVELEDLQSLDDTIVRTDVMRNKVKPLEVPNPKVETFYLVDFENVGHITERFCLFPTEKAVDVLTTIDIPDFPVVDFSNVSKLFA